MRNRTHRHRRRFESLPAFDVLERRDLRAGIQLIPPSTLLIVGTNGNNTIKVTPWVNPGNPGGPAKIRATLTSSTGAVLADRVMLSANVSRIEILAEDGDDAVTVDVPKPCTVDGGSGNDVIQTSDERDDIDGGDGDDEVHAGDERDTIQGGIGDDSLFGGPSEDTLFGGEGDDELSGEDAGDWLEGDGNNDEIWGGSGPDTVLGDDGDDMLYGGDHSDHLYGGFGFDVLEGEEGEDELQGNEDEDRKIT